MIRVLIVDDHPIIRQGIRALFMSTSDVKAIDEARDGIEAISKAHICRPDIVLLDISLPGKGGLEVLKQLHSEMPEVHVLILSVYPEKQYAIRCLNNGARGYLTKESAGEELITAIRRVAEGRKYVSVALADLLVSEIGSDAHQLPHEELSDREFQVLCLLGKGKTVSQIAVKLSVSLPTVNTYRVRILGKMKMRSTAELMHYAIESHLSDELE
jgi:DNA-binding NarL/FixJ family response regulator